jgi:phosphoglycolate phosphatase-like HAD superfamily hydrolase
MLREGAAALGCQPGERLVVIGDSEHDVTGAHAVGAIAVGVATGDWSEAELAAAGADATLADLGELDRALAALLGD